MIDYARDLFAGGNSFLSAPRRVEIVADRLTVLGLRLQLVVCVVAARQFRAASVDRGQVGYIPEFAVFDARIGETISFVISM